MVREHCIHPFSHYSDRYHWISSDSDNDLGVDWAVNMLITLKFDLSNTRT